MKNNRAGPKTTDDTMGQSPIKKIDAKKGTDKKWKPPKSPVRATGTKIEPRFVGQIVYVVFQISQEDNSEPLEAAKWIEANVAPEIIPKINLVESHLMRSHKGSGSGVLILAINEIDQKTLEIVNAIEEEKLKKLGYEAMQDITHSSGKGMPIQVKILDVKNVELKVEIADIPGVIASAKYPNEDGSSNTVLHFASISRASNTFKKLQSLGLKVTLPVAPIVSRTGIVMVKAQTKALATTVIQDLTSFVIAYFGKTKKPLKIQSENIIASWQHFSNGTLHAGDTTIVLRTLPNLKGPDPVEQFRLRIVNHKSNSALTNYRWKIVSEEERVQEKEDAYKPTDAPYLPGY